MFDSFDFLNQLQFAGDQLSLKVVLGNLIVGLVLGLALRYHFIFFGRTLSSKRSFSELLPFLVLIVTLIIAIVKSSLALSLGLVGALSIVRFRTPVKEAEELIYLFMAIAMGLGLGANQTHLTVVASIVILILVAVFRFSWLKLPVSTHYLSLSVPASLSSEMITALVADAVTRCELKRIDQGSQLSELVFLVQIDAEQQLFRLLKQLKAKHKSIQVTVMDQERLPGV